MYHVWLSLAEEGLGIRFRTTKDCAYQVRFSLLEGVEWRFRDEV